MSDREDPTASGDHDDVDTLREALFGRSVVSVEMKETGESIGDYGSQPVQGVVRLDDGRVLKLAGNEGGCSCGAGDYELTRLNSMPINGITDVQVQVDDDDESEYETDTAYRIFVLAQDDRIELAAFEGNDGNGYYGTGFWFSVTAGLERPVEPEEGEGE